MRHNSVVSDYLKSTGISWVGGLSTGPSSFGASQYVDDILLIGNDFEMLPKVEIQLATQFQMKDLGDMQYVLGIKIIRDRKNKIITLS